MRKKPHDVQANMLVFIQHVESCHYAVVAFLLETLEAPWQIWQCRACGTRPFVAASSRWLCQIRIWSGLDTGRKADHVTGMTSSMM